MEIEFKDKPSDELIKKYCKTLERFLSAHDISIFVELWNGPIRIETYIENELTGITHFWIKRITINGKGLKNFEVSIPGRHGFNEIINDSEIWYDAAWIQHQLYNHLKLNPGHPLNKDPYWKLWDYLEETK